MKKRRVQFYVEAKDYLFIARYAKECDRTISNLAQHAMMQLLKRYAHYGEKVSE